MADSTTIPIMTSTMSSLTSTSANSTMALLTIAIAVNLVNQPLLLLSNMANMMAIKLDSTNYIVWKHQVTMVLETYSRIFFERSCLVYHYNHQFRLPDLEI